jgi:hypothetical protein
VSNGTYSNQWGPTGGSATPVGSPEPLQQALSYGAQSANQSVIKQPGKQSLLAQMAVGVLSGQSAESSVPAGPNMG